MSQAIYDTITVDIDANKYNFRASGQTLKFKGFMALYVESKDQEEKEEDDPYAKYSQGRLPKHLMD